jgi:hypothetical protein
MIRIEAVGIKLFEAPGFISMVGQVHPKIAVMNVLALQNRGRGGNAKVRISPIAPRIQSSIPQ